VNRYRFCLLCFGLTFTAFLHSQLPSSTLTSKGTPQISSVDPAQNESQSAVPKWAQDSNGREIPSHDEHIEPRTPSPAGLYVAMGDSITFGVGVTNACQAFPAYPVDIEGYCPDGTSYPVLAAKALRAAGIAGHFMNIGIGGATVEQVIEDELPYLPATTTLVTLYIGTNDSRKVADLPIPTVVDRFEKDFDSLLVMIHEKAPAARIVLLNFPNEKYLAASYHVTDEVMARYDQTSQALAAFLNEHYPRYTVIDNICQATSYETDLLYKGSVHPNDTGAAVLAQHLVVAILANQPPPPPSACVWYNSVNSSASLLP
jgi:lysophospholipase L1-like esterase